MARRPALSLLLNLAMLMPSLYMLQVFDRVFASRSIETLVMLSVLTLLALGCIAWTLRARVRWRGRPHAASAAVAGVLEQALRHGAASERASGAAARRDATAKFSRRRWRACLVRRTVVADLPVGDRPDAPAARPRRRARRGGACVARGGHGTHYARRHRCHAAPFTQRRPSRRVAHSARRSDRRHGHDDERRRHMARQA